METNKRKSRRTNKTSESRDRDKWPSDRVGEREDSTRTIQLNKAEEIELDEWQREVLKYDGNIALRAGRQVGKSTIISIKAAKYAIYKERKSVLIISATERQAYLLFSKVLAYITDNYKWTIKAGKDRPTKTTIKLKNGSIIRCLPTGLDGYGIRGFTTDLLIADEAALIPEDVWPAVTPMMATTGGNIILLSTPMGARGYFYERCQDEDFKTWHISSEVVAENRKEPQKTYMLNFQEKEKQRMTKLQYAQEYLGEFVDEFRRVFPDYLIKECCILKQQNPQPNREYFLGVDIARLGDDYGSYEIIKKLDKNNFQHVHHEYSTKFTSDQTFEKIIRLNDIWNFKKIGIDAGSGTLGVGILDFLLKEDKIKRKITALNNRQRALDAKGEKTARLLKEDMYLNLRAMLEKGNLKLLDNEDVINSLRSIQYEYNTKKNKKTSVYIFAKDHRDTDLVEGLIRAAWLANQKHLSIWVRSIKI